jgi:L-threonylcarbamoyladenylate synthase
VVTALSDEVLPAAQALVRGELIGLPTETVYGLAADALNPAAVNAIYTAKGRPPKHPLIVHVADATQVPVFASEVPAFAQGLMAAFWPGPLTLILKRQAGVAETAAGGHATIALRCPSHPMAQAVLQAAHALGVQGVAAPSANLFGRVSPTTAAHVRDSFPDLLVLDGGACEVGIESTIVDCSRDAPVLLRPGMLSLSQLSAASGVHVLNAVSHAPDTKPQASTAAPGTLASHYAPHARVRLMTIEQMRSQLHAAKLPLATWSRTALHHDEQAAWPEGVQHVPMPWDAASCAHDLFSQLRAMDALGVAEIWVEAPPSDEAWDGVRDRLERAAHPSSVSDPG